MSHGRKTFSQLLLELSLTSNGRTASYTGISSAGDNTSPILTKDLFDAPQDYYAREWDRATSEIERAHVYDRAFEALRAIKRTSRGVVTYVEDFQDLAEHVVKYGEGATPKEVAVSAKCTESMVRKFRRDADCDEERGRPNRDGRSMAPAARGELVREIYADGDLSARQIAKHLHVSESTVFRDLGWKT